MSESIINSPVSIIHIEDSPEDAELVRHVLEENGFLSIIRVVADEKTFRQELGKKRPDVILADYNLPGYSGVDALILIREVVRDIPFIFVTGAVGEEMAVETLKLGATDFILKKNLRRLPPAISRALNEVKILKDRKILFSNLKNSEENYRTLVDNLPVGVFRSSAAQPGKIIQANKAALAMLGFNSMDEISSYRVEDLYVEPEERGEVIAELIRRGMLRNRLIDFRKKDDGIVNISITASVHFNAEGVPEWLDGILEDVTDKKEAEEKIAGYVKFLETLIDTINNPVFYKDVNGIYLGCNNAFSEKIIGLPRSRIIGKSLFELNEIISLEQAKQYNFMDQNLIGSPGQQVYETVVKCADGINRDFHFSKSTYPGPDGKIAGIVGIMVDISERVKSENELRRINEEFDTLITSMPSIIIGVSVKDRIRQINPYTEKIFGIKSEEICNKRFFECGIKWDWETVYEGIGSCMFEEKVIRIDELRFTNTEGKEGILGLTINPLIRNNTIIEGFIILGKDLTEQKILEGQLLQSRKLEAIGQLAAGVAHEINTPLQYVGDNLKFINKSFTGILNILDVYQRLIEYIDSKENENSLTKQVNEYSQQIKLPFLLEQMPKAIEQSLEGVDRVSAIVQSMKSFSHPGLGSKQPADINKSIENTVMVSRNEWKYDAEVVLELDETLPEIPCLESELNQVILNLIINSVDAIHEAREKGKTENGIIKIITKHDDKDAIIIVQDNGTGIPKEIREKIFDPFFTTKEVGKGTGQGLAISYNVIVEKHGGIMYVDSEYGKSTIFTIKLPKTDE